MCTILSPHPSAAEKWAHEALPHVCYPLTAAGRNVMYLDRAVDVGAFMQHSPSHNALTVSEASDFTRAGGIIRLFMQDNRLRFDVNIDNARGAGLKISSDLLTLASQVEQQSRL